MKQLADARRLGRYELRDEIGRGGMSVVYRALDTMLERQVALKLLHPHLAHDKESRTRFRREAQAVAQLKHPNLLEIYDFSGSTESDEVFIVMELVEGTNLRRFLEQVDAGKISAPAAALILQRIALALSQAHQHGIVHRDVKPENILISSDGIPKLSDFGIAHLVGRSDMTQTGQILGSPAYMSPEHIVHSELDSRADIFSLGTVLYEMVTGEVPFAGKNPHAVIKKLVEGRYIDPLSQTPAVGREVAEVIRKCLKTAPGERYQTAAELVGDLESAAIRLGVVASDATLSEFFGDPHGWTLKQQPKIIAATLAQATAARKAGLHAEAAEHFNCVLALEPCNPEALSALVGMGRTRRLRKHFERAFIFLPILAVLLAGAWSLLGSPSPSPTRALHASAPMGQPRVRKLQTKARERPRDLPQEVERQRPVGVGSTETDSKAPDAAITAPQPSQQGGGAKVRVGTRQVVFTPHPLAVRVTIDGAQSFDFGPANRSRELSVGKHTVTFTPLDSRRFETQSWSIDVPPGQEAFMMRERLRLRPGKLLVKSSLDTDVTVPGQKSGRTNNVFEIGMNNDLEKTISILVSAQGYASQTRQVTIRAGEQTTVTVMLDRTKEWDAAPSIPQS